MNPPAPPSGERRRRVAFLLDDYVDRGARILEIGPGDGWLGAYLVHAGFLDYRRLDVSPLADLVGELGRWRELGLKPGSFEILVACDGLHDDEAFRSCFALLVPGGQLFVCAPRPGRRRMAALLVRLGLRRRGLAGALALAEAPLGRFEVRKRRREVFVDEWVCLRRPLESSGEVRVGA